MRYFSGVLIVVSSLILSRALAYGGEWLLNLTLDLKEGRLNDQ